VEEEILKKLNLFIYLHIKNKEEIFTNPEAENIFVFPSELNLTGICQRQQKFEPKKGSSQKNYFFSQKLFMAKIFFFWRQSPFK